MLVLSIIGVLTQILALNKSTGVESPKKTIAVPPNAIYIFNVPILKTLI